MSQENVELWRAQIEAVRAGYSEVDREEMLARIAKFWDPEIEWDASAVAPLDIGKALKVETAGIEPASAIA
jgi:hypothetical protein